MAYKLQWEDKGVYWQYSGRVSGDEIVEASTCIYGDSRFDSLKYKLVDFLKVESVDIDQEQLALIAYQHRAAERANPYVKNAIVLKADHAMARSFAAFFSDTSWDVEIFTDLETANKWVGR